jgi:hypothetical protein
MSTRIVPQGSQRFVSLPVLGPLMDRYTGTPPIYSYRSATIGSTRVARRAGI